MNYFLIEIFKMKSEYVKNSNVSFLFFKVICSRTQMISFSYSIIIYTIWNDNSSQPCEKSLFYILETILPWLYKNYLKSLNDDVNFFFWRTKVKPGRKQTNTVRDKEPRWFYTLLFIKRFPIFQGIIREHMYWYSFCLKI